MAAKIKGFTPVSDQLCQRYGALTALIYGRVWRYSEMNGYCTASLSRMSKEIGVSVRTFQRGVEVLELGGYLSIEERPGLTNVYKPTSKIAYVATVEEKTEPMPQSHNPMTESHETHDTESYKETEEETKEDTVPEDETYTLTPYSQLLRAFVNSSQQPVLDVGKKDNEALLKMVEAGCLPEDVEAAVAYSTDNSLPMSGPSSVLKGTIIAMGKRKREGSRRAPSKLGNRPFPKGA